MAQRSFPQIPKISGRSFRSVFIRAACIGKIRVPTPESSRKDAMAQRNLLQISEKVYDPFSSALESIRIICVPTSQLKVKR
ncbi:MAG: hypothetical protein IT279_04390 [Ignavibacteriaceae bacterium]|nr:hypothetical protein [Ignavibacteriaceae bacterium]